MNEKDIKRKVKAAVENSTPDVLDKVLLQCREQNRREIIMKNSNRRNIISGIIGFAAALVLVAGSIFGYNVINNDKGVAAPDVNVAYATVTFDVNPSIEIEVAGNESVIEVKALNEDAKKVLDDMNFKNADLKVAVNAIIGSMVRNGYINELSNSILISVDAKYPDFGTDLQKKISGEVEKLLASDKFNGAVLSQSVNGQQALDEKAKQYGITAGKAELINKIIAVDSRYSFEQLAALSINELNLLSASGKNISDSIGAVGEASDGKYIGRDKAKQIALEHALGGDTVAVSDYKCEMEFENGKMVYEIEFSVGNIEYEYDINAIDGAVVKVEKDIDDDLYENDRDDEKPIVSKPSAENEEYIGVETAKQKAFAHSGVAAANALEVKAELDRENDKMVYEVEFKYGKFEYDYEIDAKTGDIIKSEKEFDD